MMTCMILLAALSASFGHDWDTHAAASWVAGMFNPRHVREGADKTQSPVSGRISLALPFPGDHVVSV